MGVKTIEELPDYEEISKSVLVNEDEYIKEEES